MPLVRLVLGGEGFAGVEVPEACTVGRWKELVAQGTFLKPTKVLYAEKLRCHRTHGGAKLDDEEALPLHPARAVVSGPGAVLTMLGLALRQRVGDPIERVQPPEEDVVLTAEDPFGDYARLAKSVAGVAAPAEAAPAAPRLTLIFLHGFEDSGQKVSSQSRDALADFVDRGLRVVLPTAATMEVTAYKKLCARAWYDYLTDAGGAREDQICEESLAATCDRLQELVDAEAVRAGGHSRVLLGGASQGCCAAFDAFARHKERLGGFIGFVGHPLYATPVKRSAQMDGVPCHFYNGAADDYMRPAWVLPAFTRLREAQWTGLEVELAEGVDHTPSLEVQQRWFAASLEPYFK